MSSKENNATTKKSWMCKAIIEKIREAGANVSFAELYQLPGFAGDSTLFGKDDKREVILWAGINSAWKKAILNLVQMDIIQIDSSSVVTYINDGMVLPLPLSGKQGEAVWAPSVLNKGAQWVE